MTALGEKNPLSCQTIPARSTTLALLADLDILTIPIFRELEQRFFKMRIAGMLSGAQKNCAFSDTIVSVSNSPIKEER
jgi:hypothetical protein